MISSVHERTTIDGADHPDYELDHNFKKTKPNRHGPAALAISRRTSYLRLGKAPGALSESA